MKKIYLLFLVSLFSDHALAITETFLRMKPNKEYMQFVLTKYSQWHDKKFPAQYKNVSSSTMSLFDTALKEIDHWKVPQAPEHSQFTLAHDLTEQKYLTQFKRIYLHPSLRSRPRQIAVGDPIFLEVFESGRECFYFSLQTKKALQIYCRERTEKNFRFRGEEYLSRELTTTWKNPFPFLLTYEIRRTDEKGQLVSISYQTKGAHPSLTPRGFDGLINLHVIEASLPFDRYTISQTGEMTVLYP